MALDGILLSKLIPEIQATLPFRIQKIYMTSQTELLLQTHGTAGKKQLLISTHSVYNRILFTNRSYPTPNEPSNFVMVLRKYLEGSIVEKIQQADLDRWMVFDIRHHNEIGDLEYLKLYVELMGKYANVILVNAQNRIIDAMKRIPPFENSRRTIQAGAEFIQTPSQDKKNPFIEQNVDMNISLTKQFSGFSPFLAKEVEYRMSKGQTFHSIMEEISNSKSIFIANSDNEPVFHCIDLTSIGPCKEYPLFEGIDILYFHREEKERIKQLSGDIQHFITRQLKHQSTKLPRLIEEYEAAKDCDKWREYGDLLYAYQITDTKGLKEITLNSFVDDAPVHIPLDPKLDGKGNARKVFQKYNKLKKGQVYLQEQIQLCQMEIDYFSGLSEQLKYADFETAMEIREELVKQGYLFEKEKGKKKKKKKDVSPSYTTITTEQGISISFGKNNLQNDALTWHTKKSNIWFHTKDYHGSHVVVHDDNPDEYTIRLAANIAAYFSAGRLSSSVPVAYCPIKNLKKIPGAKPGMVELGKYKTIYIDPDEEQISQYINL